MRPILLAIAFTSLLFVGTPAEAVTECPQGQVRFDVVTHSFDYGGLCLPNRYCVYVDSDHEWTWWTDRLGCDTTGVCASTEQGLVWLGPVGYGSYRSPGTYHIIWSGGCQVPGPNPPNWEPKKIYLPLVMR